MHFHGQVNIAFMQIWFLYTEIASNYSILLNIFLYFLLAIAIAVNSAIALAYYIKVVKFMYLREPVKNEAASRPSILVAGLILLLLLNFLFGLWPQPIFSWINF